MDYTSLLLKKLKLSNADRVLLKKDFIKKKRGKGRRKNK